MNVHIPKDKVSNQHMGYGFVEYATEADSKYAMKVLNMIKLYGKAISVSPVSSSLRVMLCVSYLTFVSRLLAALVVHNRPISERIFSLVIWTRASTRR